MQDPFSRTLIRAMVLVMVSDGYGSDSELAVVADRYESLTQRTIDRQQLGEKVKRLHDPSPFWAAVQESNLPDPQREDILRACIAVAMADSELAESEMETLGKIAKALGVRGRRLRELMSETWRAEVGSGRGGDPSS